MAKNVLIAGFEPFGGEKVNPSALVARSMEGRLIGGRSCAVRVLPVETRNIRERLDRAVAETTPDIILLMGQASGRTALALERVAVNLLDFEQPDNVGVMRKNDPVTRGGPDARISTLPFHEIVDAWAENGIPGYVSNSAGTFVCNQALYEALALAETHAPPIVAGMLHLPLLPAQVVGSAADRTPSMAFDLMKRAAEILLETVVPWVDQRPAERSSVKTPAAKGPAMWIPRGVKEVER